jgi:hypothetical protein
LTVTSIIAKNNSKKSNKQQAVQPHMSAVIKLYNSRLLGTPNTTTTTIKNSNNKKKNYLYLAATRFMTSLILSAYHPLVILIVFVRAGQGPANTTSH